jgi:putative transposase
MTFPLVRDLAAEGFPVRLTCGVLGFTAQAYYKWLAEPVSARELEDAYLTNALLDAHADDPAFGYRFLADELDRAGITVGERRVWRLCSQQRLWSTTVRKGRRGKGGKPGPAVHDDHVQRNFTAAAPNRTWVTDITEHPTGEGKVYCCAIKDLFSNRIVGYAIGDRMTADLAVAALRAAIARRQPDGVVIVHADRGSQGGFNWSSQHLDGGVERWEQHRDRSECVPIGGRSRHRVGPRWRGGKIGSSSGRLSPAA